MKTCDPPLLFLSPSLLSFPTVGAGVRMREVRRAARSPPLPSLSLSENEIVRKRRRVEGLTHRGNQMH